MPDDTSPLSDALDAATLPADAVEVARIGAAWGIQGGFHVVPLSAQPQAVLSSKRWYILPPERAARHFAHCLLLPIAHCKAHGDGLVAQSRAIDNRNAAECLKNARVFVPRASFPTLPDDEFYWVDLIGCTVTNREGVALGVVSSLMANGPQTTLVLEAGSSPTGKPQQRLIPFVSAFVDTVDIAQQRLVVDWQPDY